MSIFQKQLDSYKKNIEELKKVDEVEEEPYEDDFSNSPSPAKKEVAKPSAQSTIAKIQEQAREKANKEIEELSKTDTILNNFKRFLAKEKRTKFISSCEGQDTGKLGYITFMAFSRSLKNLGFRLLFDQVRTLVEILNVYDQARDRVFYYKAVGAAFRKLYLKQPYVIPQKLSQSDAIVKIQRIFRKVKEQRMNKNKRKPGQKESEIKQIDPKIIIQGIAQKISSSDKTLLQTFQEIDKDGSGFIEKPEVELLMVEYGLNLTQQELDAAFDILDEGKNGKITFRTLSRVVRDSAPTKKDVLASVTVSEQEKELALTEILQGIQKAINESNITIDSVFKLFDVKQSGKITFDAFYTVMKKITPNYSQFYIRQVFNHIDESHDGNITFEEFSNVFFKKKETPAEMLKRKEQEEEKMKKEKEIKFDRDSLSARILEEIKTEEAAKQSPFSLKNIIGESQKTEEIGKKVEETKRPEEFGRKPEEFGRKPDEFSRKPEEFGRKPEEFGRKPDEFSRKPEELGRKPEEFGRKPEEFGRKPEEFGRKPEEFGRKPEEKKFDPTKPPESQKPSEAPKTSPKEPIPEVKPTLREEIEKQQKRIEDEERKKIMDKLEAERDPWKKKLEEQKKKEKELYEAKLKKEEEEKKKKSLMGSILAKTTASNKGQSYRSSGKGSFRGTRGVSPAKPKPTLQEKASKLVPKPQESQIVLKAQSKELQEMVKNEFLMPILTSAVAHGESIKLARSIQKQFEKRGVIKHVYVWDQEWEQAINNPLPRSLWGSGLLGRAGYLDHQGCLAQFDLSSGSSLSSLHLGTRAPLQNVPLLGAACDESSNRLYTLNKQWVIDVWELIQSTSVPIQRISVLSKSASHDYVEKAYNYRHRDLFPNLISLSAQKRILINATCANGFVYCYDPVSFNLLWRIRVTISELQIPKPILDALDQLVYVIKECGKIGIHEDRVFKLLDRNGDGVISYEELKSAILDLNLPMTEGQIKGLFRAMDVNSTGSVSIDEFWGALYYRKQTVEDTEEQGKAQIIIPEWVTHANDNEKVKETLYKLFKALENKGYSAQQLFSVFDSDNSGVITRSEFFRALSTMLSPFVSDKDIEVLIQIADRDNNGSINYQEFMTFLSRNKIGPMSALNTLRSSEFPKDSLKYILHKSLELGIDLYKLCKELDLSGQGSLPKHEFSTLLLSLPVGITARELDIVIERDLSYDNFGNVDYLDIFEKEEYINLVAAAKRPGVILVTPTAQEQAAIIEDFAFLDDFNILAYSTREPMTSVIFLKHISGKILAKLVGHWNGFPPIMKYIQAPNAIISAERRALKPQLAQVPTCALPPCELLLWNLKKDLFDKFQINPPWTVKPYKKVPAHDGSVVDIDYLPISQLIVTAGSDQFIKFWSPTGVPYKLTEPHNLPVYANKPGKYRQMQDQFTKTNQVLSCVGVMSTKDKHCYKLRAVRHNNREWLLTMHLGASSSKLVSGTLHTWALQRMNLNVPAEQHDWPVPENIKNSLGELFKSYRKKSMLEYKAHINTQLEAIMQQMRLNESLKRELHYLIVKAILFDQGFPEIVKQIGFLPSRKQFKTGNVSTNEFYSALSQYGALQGIIYPQFEILVDNLDVQLRTSPILLTKTYKHPGFSIISKKIREQNLNIIDNIKEREIKATGMIFRNTLKQFILSLGDITEGQAEGMLDELDPNGLTKIEIKKFLGLFNEDILAQKILSISKPTDIINSLRACIFPKHGLRLQYTIIEMDDKSTGKLTFEQFARCFKICQISIDNDILKSSFSLFTDDENLLKIGLFIKEVYSGSIAQQIDEVDLLLTELKCRLIHLRYPLDVFFVDQGTIIECISIQEFIDKAKSLSPSSNEELIHKAGIFLAMPSNKTPGIFRTHFLKHINRLPNSFKFNPTVLPDKEFLNKFISDCLLLDEKLLKECLQEVANSEGMVGPVEVRSLLEKYYNIPGASGIADLVVKLVMDAHNLHFSQFLTKLRQISEKALKPRDSWKWEIREIIEKCSMQRPFNSTVLEIFNSWNLQPKQGSDRVIDIHDFINTLRFSVPTIPENVLSNLLMQGPTIDYKDFTAEVFRDVPGLMDSNMRSIATLKVQDTVDKALEKISLTLRGSQMSIKRAFTLFDANGDGSINTNELGQILGLLDFRLNNEEIMSLGEAFDKNHDGKIDYMEFIDSILSYSNIKSGQDISHWRSAAAKLARGLLLRFTEISSEFRKKALERQPDSEYITYREFREIFDSIKGFSLEDVEELADYGIEGTKKQDSSNLLPSQLSKPTYAISKSNETINFILMLEVSKTIQQESNIKQEQSAMAAKNQKLQQKAEEKKVANAVQLSSYVLKERQKAQDEFESKTNQQAKQLEKELFEYLASKLNEKEVSLKELFTEIDADQTGEISTHEFEAFMKKLGYHLTPAELNGLIKAIDINSDGSVSYQELRDKLIGYGYEATKYDAGIETLEKIQKDFDRKNKKQPCSEAMEEAIKKYNSLEQLKSIVDDFGYLTLNLYKQAAKGRKKRGLELYSGVYRVNEGLGLIRSAVIRYQSLLDHLEAFALERIIRESNLLLIKQDYNVQASIIQGVSQALIPRIPSQDFKLYLDTLYVMNFATKQYLGVLLTDQTEIQVTMYGPDGLRHISSDGNPLDFHLNKELEFHMFLQERFANVIKCIGVHEKRVGKDPTDKEVYVMYERLKGLEIQHLLDQNGGLLKIPILYNTKAALYLAKFLGKQLLNLIYTVQTHSFALRNLNLSSFVITENAEIKLNSLKGSGKIDINGKIISAPDIVLCLSNISSESDFLNNPFLAPEFILRRDQSTSVDVWSFGAILYSLLFGVPPPSFFEAYKIWCNSKGVISPDFQPNSHIIPSTSFPYNPYSGFRIVKYKAVNRANDDIGIIRSIRLGSFSGIVDDNESYKGIGSKDLQEIYEQSLNLKHTTHAEKNELGLILDLIALCLQIDPLKRPTIKGLLSSPIFEMDQFEQKQAERFASHLFYYKDPELVITQRVSVALRQISENTQIEFLDTTLQIIHYLNACFFDTPGGFMTAKNMSKLVTVNSFTIEEKDKKKLEDLSSPSSELIKQAINDKVFDMLAAISISYYKKGEESAIKECLELLTYMNFEMNINFDAIFLNIIAELGMPPCCYPYVAEYTKNNKHPDYSSELLMLAENFALLKRESSSVTARRNAIRHIRAMIQLGNENKLEAARDFRLPKHILHCLQDSDFQVRFEATLIMLEISKGCKIKEIPVLEKEISETMEREEKKQEEEKKQSEINKTSLGAKANTSMTQGENKQYQTTKPTVTFRSDTKPAAATYKSDAKPPTKTAPIGKIEYTEEFLKLEKERELKVLEIKRDIAKCFENPIFIAPIVRLVKLKSEPYDTKDAAVKILFAVLNGTEKCQDAALCPATDTLSTLCKCLVISNRTADTKSGKNLAMILRNLFTEFLEKVRPKLLKAIMATPGAEALLREQGIGFQQ
ncbi:unnamed protein product [Blepharisma stoltei]|uniref:Uncharacterized protein n=1 Tax=Blepharisma stoltei TaxID=1481888 RepID=A0AAU9IP20_9CILI|nr:unnamed protein product [Blepharisma stoltei]